MKKSLAEKTNKNKKKPSAACLLKWYDKNRRVMPWRALMEQAANPYHVWLSEIMLQQTTVVAVRPYFLKFIKRWPTLSALARADLEEIRQMWGGLGYYRRAQRLHECARKVMALHRGQFPADQDALLALPGIGPYTAAAVMAIAFDRRANVVDGNVERVMARLFAVAEPLPRSKKKLKELAESCLPNSRYGDYAQALMDLGAMVCKPRSPRCDLCPLDSFCVACQLRMQESYPARTKNKAKPKRHGFAFVLFDKKRRVFLRQRKTGGLLGGMMEVPSTEWVQGKGLAWEEAQMYAPQKQDWRLLWGRVHHTFTHFDLELGVAVAFGTTRLSGQWVEIDRLDHEALPSVMRKILAFALKEIRGDG